MSGPSPVPSVLAGLTDQQLLATTTDEARCNIEAAPGAGKTTVASLRFGHQRFSTTRDQRAVIAVSFTKASTRELRHRVLRLWGPRALAWPHRVVTLDGILRDLLEQLLQTGLLRWPDGHTSLQVIDTWVGTAPHTWSQKQPVLLAVDGRVEVRIERLEGAQRIGLADFRAAVRAGTCTHDDVRRVLESALTDPAIKDVAMGRVQRAWRSLIVDEVYDANRLDLRFAALAADVGTNVTLVGDPWQALYLFRSASPDLVPHLVAAKGFRTRELTASFRFKTPETQQAAQTLRHGGGLSLPASTGTADIAIGTRWTHLWELAPATTLPISFGSPDSLPKAAANLLLDQVVRARLGRPAVYLPESLRALGLDDEAGRSLQPSLVELLNTLSAEPRLGAAAAGAVVREVWNDLRAIITHASGTTFPRENSKQRDRIDGMRRRLVASGGHLVPALTVHQAKGQEWDDVQLVLTAAQTQRLASGLTRDRESDRELYVAATRARYRLST